MAKVFMQHFQNNAFEGTVTYLDIHMKGTLGDLAQSRADLAVIALPNEQLEAAMEVVGRIQCRSALILSMESMRLSQNVCTRSPINMGFAFTGTHSLGFQRA